MASLDGTGAALPAHTSVKHMRGGWQCHGIPCAANEEDVLNAFRAVAAGIDGSFSAHVDIRRNAKQGTAFAFVTPLGDEGISESSGKSLVAQGVTILGTVCRVKKRRRPKRERVAEMERRVSAKKVAAERAAAKRSAWQPLMLEKFPFRENCMDQIAKVGDLCPDLVAVIESVYLRCVFPACCRSEVVAALRHIWINDSKSLRVKELFETLETYKLVEKHVSEIKAAAKRRGDPGIESIFDFACGHGLLGVLLAYRFSDVRVVCVDLKMRPCYNDYVAAFQMHGVPDKSRGETVPLSNLSFAEKDFAHVADDISSTSFLVMIHGCNEASRDALDIAKSKRARYAFMPCCIRDGLYCVKNVRHAPDADRYALMVGVLAGTYGASAVAAIDKRITNRNLMIFGHF